MSTEAPTPGKPAMVVRFWGTRGSIPTPGADTVKYGGNTSCVEVSCAGGTFILDAGSGIRMLGEEMAKQNQPDGGVHLLLSHYHWDHIQGLLFFRYVFEPGRKIDIYCPDGLGAAADSIFSHQMQEPFFPVDPSALQADIKYRTIYTDTFDINGVKVSSCRVRHPGIVLSYRLDYGGRSVVYATDREPDNLEAGEDDMSADLVRLTRGADLLIHDAQYYDEEYRNSRRGWGHSPLGEAMRVAAAAGVKRLALFHHDPGHWDAELSRVEKDVSRQGAAAGFQAFLAAEGRTLEL